MAFPVVSRTFLSFLPKINSFALSLAEKVENREEIPRACSDCFVNGKKALAKSFFQPAFSCK